MFARRIGMALLLACSCDPALHAEDTRTPEQIATDQANAQAAQANAQIAQSNAQIQQIKIGEEKVSAAKAAAPQSGLTNSATAGSGAGTAEANYMASKLVNRMAQRISTAVETKIVGKPVVLFTGLTAPDFSDWAVFETRRQIVFDEMNNAVKDYGPKKNKMFVAALAALIPSVLSFLSSNDTASGITVSTSNEMLETALASVLLTKHHVRIASTNINKAALAGLDAKLKELAALRKTVDEDITDAGSVDKLAGAAKTKAENLATAAADYDQFKLDLIGGKGADGKFQAATLSLSNIAKQYAMADQIKDGSAIFVSVQSAAGGLFTRKNLVTFFGVNPFSVSASAVVYYAVLDGATDETVAAGTLQQITPYRSIKLK